MSDAARDKVAVAVHKCIQRNSCAARLEPSRGSFGEIFHAVDFRLELPPARRGKAVSLFVPRCVVQIDRLYPTVFKKTANRPEQSACTHPDTAAAQIFN